MKTIKLQSENINNSNLFFFSFDTDEVRLHFGGSAGTGCGRLSPRRQLGDQKRSDGPRPDLRRRPRPARGLRGPGPGRRQGPRRSTNRPGAMLAIKNNLNFSFHPKSRSRFLNSLFPKPHFFTILLNYPLILIEIQFEKHLPNLNHYSYILF